MRKLALLALPCLFLCLLAGCGGGGSQGYSSYGSSEPVYTQNGQYYYESSRTYSTGRSYPTNERATVRTG